MSFALQVVMEDTKDTSFLDVCQQLDNLVVKYFQTLADVFMYRQMLDNYMKDGFFHMAKVIYCFYQFS